MATTLPRRSSRIAALTSTPIVEPQPQLHQQPQRSKDTRLRCKTGRCNRLSCDSVTAFCDTHKPEPPSDHDLLTSYIELDLYINANPLRTNEWYAIESINQRDEIDAKIIEYQTYEKELDTVLEPYTSLYELCEDLHIDHPFVSHYTKIEGHRRKSNTSWDFLMDKYHELKRYGWLASNRGGKGWRGHSALCEVCREEVLYESDEQPTIHYCPTHFAEKKKEVHEQMEKFMAQPPGVLRTLDVLMYTLENFGAFPRQKLKLFVASKRTWGSPEIDVCIKELKQMLERTE